MTFAGGTTRVVNALADHAMTTGLFNLVRGSEPKTGPQDNSLVCAFWVQSIAPIPARSGLSSTSWRVEVLARIYDSAAFSPASPYEVGDAKITDAGVDLLEKYTGDFELNSDVAFVDLLGMYGTPLRGQFGYINQDGTIYRNFDITIPLVMSEEWSQA